MDRPEATLSRRGLITAAAGAGAVLATAHLATRDTRPPTTAAPSDPPAATRRYRLTEHIQHYYRTARI